MSSKKHFCSYSKNSIFAPGDSSNLQRAKRVLHEARRTNFEFKELLAYAIDINKLYLDLSCAQERYRRIARAFPSRENIARDLDDLVSTTERLEEEVRRLGGFINNYGKPGAVIELLELPDELEEGIDTSVTGSY